MAWIEVHQALLTHRKTYALAESLDLPPLYAASHMIALWLWSLDNAPSGDLLVTPRVIAKAAQWPGDPDRFVTALVDADWLHYRADEGYWLHDWEDYAGRLIEQREANAKRMRDARAKRSGIEPKERATHVQRTLAARAPATVPNPTIPNQTNIESLGVEGESHARTREAAPAPVPPEQPTVKPAEETEKRAPKPLPYTEPEPPPLVRQRQLLLGQLLDAGERLRGRRLTQSEKKVLNGFFNEYKVRLTAEIIEQAELATAAYTSDSPLEYFCKVMKRMIERPDARKPPNGGNGHHRRAGPAARQPAYVPPVEPRRITIDTSQYAKAGGEKTGGKT